MKKTLLFLLMFSIITAQGQKLKDLLYSGKLKKDSTSVIRKTDDLTSKIDTASKKAAQGKVQATVAVSKDSVVGNATSAAVVQTNENNVETPSIVASVPATPAKSNSKIWKEYTEALTLQLKDVLSSRKVKKETYYFTVEYEIGTDGKTSINNLTVSPDNDLLLSQVKMRITENPPQLNPVFNSANQPQKVKKRFNFFITKD